MRAPLTTTAQVQRTCVVQACLRLGGGFASRDARPPRPARPPTLPARPARLTATSLLSRHHVRVHVCLLPTGGGTQLPRRRARHPHRFAHPHRPYCLLRRARVPSPLVKVARHVTCSRSAAVCAASAARCVLISGRPRLPGKRFSCAVDAAMACMSVRRWDGSGQRCRPALAGSARQRVARGAAAPGAHRARRAPQQ